MEIIEIQCRCYVNGCFLECSGILGGDIFCPWLTVSMAVKAMNVKCGRYRHFASDINGCRLNLYILLQK